MLLSKTGRWNITASVKVQKFLLYRLWIKILFRRAITSMIQRYGKKKLTELSLLARTVFINAATAFFVTSSSKAQDKHLCNFCMPWSFHPEHFMAAYFHNTNSPVSHVGNGQKGSYCRKGLMFSGISKPPFYKSRL